MVSFVKTLVDKSRKTLESLKKTETSGDEKISNIVNEIETLTSEGRFIKDIEKDFPNEIEKLEEALNKYRIENDLRTLKTEFPDYWKYLNTELDYPNDFFSGDNYQKPI